MKKILWISNTDYPHEPLESQVNELKRLFGDDVQLDVVAKTIETPTDILKVYKQKFYDEMIVFAPAHIIRTLNEWGYRPLHAEMRQVGISEKPEIMNRGRGYKFVKFKRIERIDFIFSDLGT